MDTTRAWRRFSIIRGLRITRWDERTAQLPFIVLFLILFLTSIYTPPRWQDWNQNSRFDLTLAIVEQHTVRIDDYVANTGDYAEIDGHAYTDKAPGLSLSAVPVYAVVRALQPVGLSQVSSRIAKNESLAATLNPAGQGTTKERIDQAVALYLVTIMTVAIPAAVMGVLLALIIERIVGCRTAALLSALAIGLASPVFTYAQAFYGHVPAAACIVGALALIVLRHGPQLSLPRIIGIGALLGWSVVIEYPAAVASLPVALWALAIARQRAVVFGTLGALPPLAVLAIYDWIAFGTILPVGYEHSALWQEQHQTGFMSLVYPQWDAIWGITGSPYRGLFFFAPMLLLAIPGFWIGLRRPSQRVPVGIALASFLLMFLFVSSSSMWWGGFAVGPRYLLPAVPLLALPLGSLIAWANHQRARLRAIGLGTVGLLTTISSALIWSISFSRQNYPPDTLHHPVTDYVIPALRDGDVARNLGMVLHLEGLVSVFPLVVVAAIGIACLGMLVLLSERQVT